MHAVHIGLRIVPLVALFSTVMFVWHMERIERARFQKSINDLSNRLEELQLLEEQLYNSTLAATDERALYVQNIRDASRLIGDENAVLQTLLHEYRELMSVLSFAKLEFSNITSAYAALQTEHIKWCDPTSINKTSIERFVPLLEAEVDRDSRKIDKKRVPDVTHAHDVAKGAKRKDAARRRKAKPKSPPTAAPTLTTNNSRPPSPLRKVDKSSKQDSGLTLQSSSLVAQKRKDPVVMDRRDSEAAHPEKERKPRNAPAVDTDDAAAAEAESA